MGGVCDRYGCGQLPHASEKVICLPEKIMRVTWDEGADLSRSRQKPGDYSPLTRDRDTHGLGHVTLSDIDEDENDESGPAAGYAALAALGLVAAATAAPYVRQWLVDSAAPALKGQRDRFASAIRRGRRSSGTVASDAEAATADSMEVATSVSCPGVSMSSAEWQERFRLMLLAGAVQDEQWRMLSTARIENGDLLEVQQAMQSLPPEQVAEAVSVALESRGSSLGTGTVDEALQVLIEGLIDGSESTRQLGE